MSINNILRLLDIWGIWYWTSMWRWDKWKDFSWKQGTIHVGYGWSRSWLNGSTALSSFLVMSFRQYRQKDQNKWSKGQYLSSSRSLPQICTHLCFSAVRTPLSLFSMPAWEVTQLLSLPIYLSITWWWWASSIWEKGSSLVWCANGFCRYWSLEVWGKMEESNTSHARSFANCSSRDYFFLSWTRQCSFCSNSQFSTISKTAHLTWWQPLSLRLTCKMSSNSSS